MNKIVLFTCIENTFDMELAAVFVREGYAIFAISASPPVKDAAHIPVNGVIFLPFQLNEAAAVLAEKAGKLDFLIDVTDFRDQNDNFTVRDGINGAVIENVFRKNVLRSMALLEAFLPLLDKSDVKRLFYLTSAEASINETQSVNSYGYNMSRAAIHQFLQMARNRLAPAGFTFRVFDPLCETPAITAQASAESAFNYITRRRGTENNDPLRDDEDNLVFRDALGRQHSW